MIGIINYGMGNLRSVQKAFEKVGAQAQIISQPDQVRQMDKIVLPGVGAFDDAARHLIDQNYIEPIREFVKSGKPFLGICLGMQLIFDYSEEGGIEEGLSLVKGKIVKFELEDPTLTVPHMGWNALNFNPDHNDPLLKGVTPGQHVYFVHSYYALPDSNDVVSATSNYPDPFCATIYHENILATQFHPEKSQHVGMQLLKNFSQL